MTVVNPDKYYFSKIQLYDPNEIINYGIQKQIQRKKKRKLEKLEKQGIFVGRDPIKLLKKANKNFESTFSSAGVASSETIRKKWKIASLRAQGVKVKDDMSLLKKAADKVHKLKRKQAKNWKKRIEATEEKKSERQIKRTANIQARKTTKLSKKLNKAREKGRIFFAPE
ncbi:Surfeit locus protein isoform 1 [Schistosoma japonicum]|uniref:SJCHGC01161 protein n=1 Tax=Schistosoma japonicum TaxID=6182 RepID=Q86EN7_SCHJA|nr:SJCHGC01161 protein [Schistosoma japonicum]KAH8852063.1 Surfeit locus protein 6 [Schistosoma japonicum]KAH8852064.1 Surfeit locus protein 6 [Schistosoma japonicum]TNN08678.1 Surfeit locus protein isoform 1 [Schistosoma japonicum]CAX73307.1 hypothetical protein [Schistosoma japonicum]